MKSVEKDINNLEKLGLDVNNLEMTDDKETNKVLNKLKNNLKDIKNIKSKKTKQKLKKITKKQMCTLIVKHYTYRINLISTILSFVDKKDNDYKKVCYNKYLSLLEGKICLPKIDESFYHNKDFEDINHDKLIKKLYRHVKKLIGATNKKDCIKLNGRFLNLTEDKIKEIFKPNSKYTKTFNSNFKKLHKEYLQKLNLMIKILKKLDSDKILTNSKLNKIGEDLNTLTNKLYTNCNLYYITCIFAFIHLELKNNINKYKKSSSIINNMKKFIN